MEIVQIDKTQVINYTFKYKDEFYTRQEIIDSNDKRTAWSTIKHGSGDEIENDEFNNAVDNMIDNYYKFNRKE